MPPIRGACAQGYLRGPLWHVFTECLHSACECLAISNEKMKLVRVIFGVLSERVFSLCIDFKPIFKSWASIFEVLGVPGATWASKGGPRVSQGDPAKDSGLILVLLWVPILKFFLTMDAPLRPKMRNIGKKTRS